MDNYTRSLHIFLSDSQHKQLRRISRAQGEQMTKVARSAIVSYMNSFQEEEETAKRAEKARENDDRRKPSGLGVTFDPKPAVPPSPTAPVLPAIPLGMIGSITPDLKPIIEHVRSASTPEERENRIATISETVRAFCEKKEADVIVQKLKAESESGLSRFFHSILGAGKP